MDMCKKEWVNYHKYGIETKYKFMSDIILTTFVYIHIYIMHVCVYFAWSLQLFGGTSNVSYLTFEY